MNAPEFHELLSAYLDDAVSADERASVEAHLADSAESRRLLEELRAVRGALQGLPRQHLEADFADRVLRRAEREMLVGRAERAGEDSGDVVRRLGLRMILWPLIAVAAALLMALVGPELFGPAQAPHEPVARHPAPPAPDAQAGKGQRPEENQADRARIAMDKAFTNEHQMGVARVEQAQSGDATAAAQEDESMALEAFRESLGRASAVDRSNLQAAERALQRAHAQAANKARRRWAMESPPAGNSDGQVVYVMVSLKAGADPRQAMQQFVGTVEAADLGDVREKTTLSLDLEGRPADLATFADQTVASSPEADSFDALGSNGQPRVLSVHEAALDDVELQEAVQRLEAEPNYFDNVRQVALAKDGPQTNYFSRRYLSDQLQQQAGRTDEAALGAIPRQSSNNGATFEQDAAPPLAGRDGQPSGAGGYRYQPNPPSAAEPTNQPPGPDAAGSIPAGDALVEDAPAIRPRRPSPERPTPAPTRAAKTPGDLPKVEPAAGADRPPADPQPDAGVAAPVAPPGSTSAAVDGAAGRSGVLADAELAENAAAKSADMRFRSAIPARRRVVFLLQTHPAVAPATEAAPLPAEGAPAK